MKKLNYQTLLEAINKFPNHSQAARHLNIDRKTFKKYCSLFNLPVKYRAANRNVSLEEALQAVKTSKSFYEMSQKLGYKSSDTGKNLCRFFQLPEIKFVKPTPALDKHGEFLKENAHRPYRELAEELDVCINRIVVMMKTLDIKKIPAYHRCGWTRRRKNSTQCSKGHLLTQDNVTILEGKYKLCKTCKREYDKRRYNK